MILLIISFSKKISDFFNFLQRNYTKEISENLVKAVH